MLMDTLIAIDPWVETFAARLRQNGADVVLDKWNLPMGEDRFHFMERAVMTAAFVLVICTPEYAAKANDRTGGVGYEATIITPHIANRTENRKFIPILRSGDWSTSLPVWIAARRGADLSGNPYSETEFAELLRTLHREAAQAPALGPPPSFTEPTAETPPEFRVRPPIVSQP